MRHPLVGSAIGGEEHSISEPQHIAIICDYDLDYLGGAQTALIQQAAALASAGVEVTVCSPSTARAWQRVGAAGVDHVRMPARCMLPGLRLPVVPNDTRTRERLGSMLAVRKIDIVHLHSEFGLAAAALLVASRLRIPVIHTVHTFFWRAPLPGWLPVQTPLGSTIRYFGQQLTGSTPTRAPLADRPVDSALRNLTLTVAQRATRVISPSAHQASRLRAAGVSDLDVIANTTVSTDAAAEPIDSMEGPLKVVWIGRCAPEKRILPFVRAMTHAIGRLGSGRLQAQVVGDGPQLRQARGLARDFPEITFTGRRRHDQVTELLAQAHLLASTSEGFDNQPMTIVEAVTALRGVIYCDPRLVEGLSGPGIQASGTVAGLSETLIDLVRHPDRVAAASHAALASRTEFSPTTQVRQTMHSYRQALTRARSGPEPEQS